VTNDNSASETVREFELHAADGTEIFTRCWAPRDAARAVVVVAHGMSEHSNRYARVARALTDHGYVVYAPDHRGHGRTASSTGVGRTGPGGVEAIVEDLDLVRAQAVDAHPGRAVVLFGHSMGAMLSQAYAERYGDRLAGLALSGTPGVPQGFDAVRDAVRQAAEGGMADAPVSVLGGIGGDPATTRTAFDWLSRDSSEVDAYLADPYCGENHPMTYAFLAAFMTLAVETTGPDAIARIPTKLPIALMTGEADAASNMGENVRELERRMRAAGLSVESYWYPGARHEILNELNRDEVTGDLLAWIDRVTSG
jgi:alpha-beta hydrolase superfamily lysophospholipase